jgi:hypothetical protein
MRKYFYPLRRYGSADSLGGLNLSRKCTFRQHPQRMGASRSATIPMP